MRTLLVVFAILLAILILISSLGGSLNTTEKFYQEVMEEAETYTDMGEMEEFYEEQTHAAPAMPSAPIAPPTPETPVAPSTPPPTAVPADKEQTPSGPSMSTFVNGEEEVEPFDSDSSYMPF